MAAGCFVVMVSCGGFESTQHPDDAFRSGQGIGSSDAFGNYYSGQILDPRFRRARVTTESDPLILKTQPRSSSPSPTAGPASLARGAEVDVYWPLDISNNHAKVHVNGRALWVTYRSASGREYLTLLEDIYVPQTQAPSSGSFSLNAGTSFGPRVTNGPTNTGGTIGSTTSGSTLSAGFVPSDLETISLSSSQVSDAYTAIGNVDLVAAAVPACTFNPIVGNNSGSNNCYRQVIISSAFSDFVSRHGHQCAIGAAREAFGFTPSRVLFHSSGAGQVLPNRRVGSSGTLSTHATGQAFDLFAISVFNSAASRKVVMHRNEVDGSSTAERQNHTFYWSFANCWRGRVNAHADCPCGGSEAGTRTYLDDSAHVNHLHMSMPMCNRERYNVSCI